MNDKVYNEFVVRLSGKISNADLNIVKSEMILFFDDYDISRKETLPQLTDDDLLKELKIFLVSKKIEGLSENSLKQYYRTNSKFLYYVGKSVNDIVANDIRKFLFEYQRTHQVSNITLNSQKMYISSFFKWLADNDYIGKNPCIAVAPIKTEKTVKHALTELELEQLRSVCTTLREKALIEILFSTGCRVAELCRLRISDINFLSQEVTLFGKGNKYRVSFLNAKAMIALEEYLGQRACSSDYIFIGQRAPYNPLSIRAVERIVHILGEKARLSEKLYPHKLRRTTATMALSRGMRIEEIQQLLGHESLDTTMIYAKLNVSDVKRHHNKYLN